MDKVERSLRETMRRFFEPAKYLKKSLITLSLYDIVSTLLMLSLIYGSQYLVSSIENTDFDWFILWIKVLLIIAVVSFVVRTFWKPFIFSVFKNWGQRLDEIYVKKVIESDNNIYEQIWTWRMVAVFSKWISVRLDLYRSIFWDLFASLTTFLVFFVSLYLKDVRIFFVMLLSVILVIFWFYLFWKRPYVRRRKSTDEWIFIKRLQVKRFMSKQEIMQQDTLDLELDKRRWHNEKRYHFKKIEKVYQWISFDWSMLIVTLLFVFTLYLSGLRVIDGTFWYADMILIVWLGTTFLNSMSWLLRKFRILTDKWIEIENVLDLIDRIKPARDIHIWESFQCKDGVIDIQNITYAYDTEKVFDDFSLDIKWGNKTALVWVSWSGKSTLVKLIAGYLRPDSGSIIVDGQDLADTSLKSYYKHIWYLTQEPSVFDGTVSENLTYAIDGEVDQLLLDQAIKHARCEFVYDFPDGLKTEIGERGIRLSGGQRQRLAIAKIFLKDPEIIILDEPTSALDSFSEEWITEAMHNLFDWRTVIIIAHRLQTVREADDIILLEDGQVTERGTHDELVARWWQYAKMLELQSWF